MLETLLNNHLLLAAVILLFLVLVPALVIRGHKLRASPRFERRKHERPGPDRRA